ncbi:hypothetical protein KY290_010633 [Solanum tuberosum]|uniref:Uncharacterized protein n=1 Tax=Solanum tuberosum TaxID=4113 RepID=A0ABQ7VYB4_SOLTU|nr:hypothetical protein KY290_010633 [Solanum tuberosum]
MFEGDLPYSKSSESSILAASESIVIESLATMREGVIMKNEVALQMQKVVGFYKGFLEIQNQSLTKLLRLVSIHLLILVTLMRTMSLSSGPCKGGWFLSPPRERKRLQKKPPKRRPFTRAISQKLMGDAMISSEVTTIENRRKRRSGERGLTLPTDNMVDVSNEISEDEVVDADIPQAVTQKGKEKNGRKESKLKPRTSSVKKGDSTPKKRGKDTQKKREPSKRKMDTSPVPLKTSKQGLGTRKKKDEKEVSKQLIVEKLFLQKVIGGRVFDPEIPMKPGMHSLDELVEIQSWTHLFMIKSLVLHEEQV